MLGDDDLVVAFNLPDIEGDESTPEVAHRCAQRIGHADLYRAATILMMIDDQASGHYGPMKERMPAFDAVAAATKSVGVKPCGGCAKRQAALNKATPAWARRVLGWWSRHFGVP